MQLPQPVSIAAKRPIFTMPQHAREIVERLVGKQGWCNVEITDLDARFKPRFYFKTMWCGSSGSGELHFTEIRDYELEFFIRGHQYLIEVITIENRKDYLDTFIDDIVVHDTIY